jgi:hypothetical protein
MEDFIPRMRASTYGSDTEFSDQRHILITIQKSNDRMSLFALKRKLNYIPIKFSEYEITSTNNVQRCLTAEIEYIKEY